MLLAGPPRAHRIEAAEQRLSVSLAAAASRAAADAFALPLAGGAAVFANKVIGLGFAGPLEPADLGLRRPRRADPGRALATAPGSRSQHNARRQGFELLCTRAILVRRT